MHRRTSVVLGIDAGTTSVKTVAFALDGTILATTRASVHIARGPRGEAEIDMDEMWRAVTETVRATVEATPDAEIRAIGITGQGDGAWLVDADERPAGRAALWLDGRAARRTASWETDGRADAVRDATGSSLFSGALPVLLAELAATDPGLVERAAGQRNCKDWIRQRMTGIPATDPSEASRTFLRVGTGAYDPDLPGALGIEWGADLLPEVRDPASIGGVVTDRAARDLGVPAGIPVAVGLVDTAAAGVGIGAIGDGDAYAILGTTSFVGVNQSSRAATRSELAILLETGRGAQVLECLAPMTGTPNLDWVRDTLAPELDWPEIEAQASRVRPGSDGVLYLPHGATNGERAPFVDPAASAAWVGMSVTTTAAQLLRSVYEGLAFSLAECFDLLGVEGTVAICGGGSDSDLLCQILADASGRTIERQSAPEVGARGAATLALLAIGEHENLREAVEALAPTRDRFEPDPAQVRAYVRPRATSIAVRTAIRPAWPSLRALREGTTPATERNLL